MKKFIYIRRQTNGCDYTIGCGISATVIMAESKDEAIKKIINVDDTWKEDFKQNFEDGCLEDFFYDYVAGSGLIDLHNDNDFKISSAFLYEISDETNMIPVLYSSLKKLTDFKDNLLKQAEEKSERAQYEKLKKKFENK